MSEEIVFGGAYYSREFLDRVGCPDMKSGYYFKGEYAGETWEEFCKFSDERDQP